MPTYNNCPPSDEVYCLNGGECYYQAEDPTVYICSCFMPYYGPRCEHKAVNMGQTEPPSVDTSEDVTDTVAKRSVDRAMTITALVFIVITFLGLIFLAWYLSVRRRKDFAQWKKIKQRAENNSGPSYTVDRGIQVETNGFYTDIILNKTVADQSALIDELSKLDEEDAFDASPKHEHKPIDGVEMDQPMTVEEGNKDESATFAVMPKRKHNEKPHMTQMSELSIEGTGQKLSSIESSQAGDYLGSSSISMYAPHDLAKEPETKPQTDTDNCSPGYFSNLTTSAQSIDALGISVYNEKQPPSAGNYSCTMSATEGSSSFKNQFIEKSRITYSPELKPTSQCYARVHLHPSAPYGQNYYHTLTHVDYSSYRTPGHDQSQSPYVNAIDLEELVNQQTPWNEQYYIAHNEPSQRAVTYSLGRRSNPSLPIHKNRTAQRPRLEQPLIVASQHDALLSELLHRGSPTNFEPKRASIQSPT